MNLLKKIIKSNQITYNIGKLFLNNRIPYYALQFLNIPFKFLLINGNKIKFYAKGQITLSLFNNEFENNETSIFQKIIQRDMVVVDAGANIGLYSLIASKLIGEKGKVFSFEPSKETFARLCSNIELNNVTNITPLNIGLGDKIDEKLVLLQDDGLGDATRYLLPQNQAPSDIFDEVSKSNVEEIIIDTLDNCLNKFNIQSIDFLKIDTEGFEYYILKGATNILKNSPNIVILMECTPTGTARANTNQDEVFKIIKNAGLNIFYWNKIKNNWCDDEDGILSAGDIWVCKSLSQLNFKK
jgi:FkbM family methyltransferase